MTNHRRQRHKDGTAATLEAARRNLEAIEKAVEREEYYRAAVLYDGMARGAAKASQACILAVREITEEN